MRSLTMILQKADAFEREQRSHDIKPLQAVAAVQDLPSYRNGSRFSYVFQ